jgi:hypothetical protein
MSTPSGATLRESTPPSGGGGTATGTLDSAIAEGPKGHYQSFVARVDSSQLSVPRSQSSDDNPQLTTVNCQLAPKPSAFHGPLDPPTSGKEGPSFWIRQKRPAEKTFPQGFE